MISLPSDVLDNVKNEKIKITNLFEKMTYPRKAEKISLDFSEYERIVLKIE